MKIPVASVDRHARTGCTFCAVFALHEHDGLQQSQYLVKYPVLNSEGGDSEGAGTGGDGGVAGDGGGESASGGVGGIGGGNGAILARQNNPLQIFSQLF